MRVYICPTCFATLERSTVKGKGRCPDCRYDWFLNRCWVIERDEIPKNVKYPEVKG